MKPIISGRLLNLTLLVGTSAYPALLYFHKIHSDVEIRRDVFTNSIRKIYGGNFTIAASYCGFLKPDVRAEIYGSTTRRPFIFRILFRNS